LVVVANYRAGINPATAKLDCFGKFPRLCSGPPRNDGRGECLAMARKGVTNYPLVTDLRMAN
jgi:hypothetical protein